MIDLKNHLAAVQRWTVRSTMMVALATLAINLPLAVSARTVEIDFTQAQFSDPLTIDNTYLPMVAGTTFV